MDTHEQQSINKGYVGPGDLNCRERCTKRVQPADGQRLVSSKPLCVHSESCEVEKVPVTQSE